MSSPIAVGAVLATTAATIVIGAYGVRVARTTSDFFVASRTVRPMWNASAISGEYLSAASFLGVAGLVMKYGVDMLWYPVGFAAGYLVLLLLVAAPLRRFGAYTIPDFAEGRLDSLQVRRLATTYYHRLGPAGVVLEKTNLVIPFNAIAMAPCSEDRRPGWWGSGTVPESSTTAWRQNPSKSSYVRRPNRTVSKPGMLFAAALAWSSSGTTHSKLPSGPAKYPSADTQLNITIRRVGPIVALLSHVPG